MRHDTVALFAAAAYVYVAVTSGALLPMMFRAAHRGSADRRVARRWAAAVVAVGVVAAAYLVAAVVPAASWLSSWLWWVGPIAPTVLGGYALWPFRREALGMLLRGWGGPR